MRLSGVKTDSERWIFLFCANDGAGYFQPVVQGILLRLPEWSVITTLAAVTVRVVEPPTTAGLTPGIGFVIVLGQGPLDSPAGRTFGWDGVFSPRTIEGLTGSAVAVCAAMRIAQWLVPLHYLWTDTLEGCAQVGVIGVRINGLAYKTREVCCMEQIK